MMAYIYEGEGSTSKQTKIESTSLNFSDLSFGFGNFAKLNDVMKYLTQKDVRPRKYSIEEIRNFLENPERSEKQLRDISRYFYLSSSHYRRLISYFSTMLTLDHFVMPSLTPTDKSFNDDAFRKNYEKCVRYIENFNVKHEIGKVLNLVLIDGVFFGYERSTNKSFTIQKLPIDYCKIIGNEAGTIIFQFDFSYFNGGSSATNNPERALLNFPDEFTVLYNKAQSEGIWLQELDSSKSICFKFDEHTSFSVPPFSSILEEIIDIDDFKAMNKSKSKLDNYKLLLQKIPMKKDAKNERDFLISLPSVQKFHDNIKATLPDQIGLVTTPMDVTDINFEKAINKDDVVGKAEQSYYNSAGVSSALFSSDKASGTILELSVEQDGSFMFPMLRQIERFFIKRLFQIGSSAYQFIASFPELTIYNREKMFDKFLKAAQYGGPKLPVFAALGVSTTALPRLLSFENDFLDLGTLLIPLSGAKTKDGNKNG
jgi:hypothetical protein